MEQPLSRNKVAILPNKFRLSFIVIIKVSWLYSIWVGLLLNFRKFETVSYKTNACLWPRLRPQYVFTSV